MFSSNNINGNNISHNYKIIKKNIIWKHIFQYKS